MIDRNFELYEKILAKEIKDEAIQIPKSLCEILSKHYFTDKALLFDSTNRQVSLFVDAKLFNTQSEAYRKDVAKFWRLFDMIEFLCENDYMAIMPYFPLQKASNINVVWKECSSVQISNGKIFLNKTDEWNGLDITRNGQPFLKGVKFPPQYYDKLEKWFGDAYVLPKFEKLIANDFKSDEIIRSERTLCWARVAGIAAILGIVASIITLFV